MPPAIHKIVRLIGISAFSAFITIGAMPAAFAENQGQAYAYYMQGLRQESDGDLNGAIESFRRSISNATRVKEVHHELAKCLARTGVMEPAYSEFSSAINIDGNYVECRNNFGQFLLKTNKPKQARIQFERCIAIDPKFPYAYYSLGKLLKDQGDLAGAIDNFQHTVNLMPSFAEAQEALGMAIFERASQGDLSMAQEKLEAASRLVPKNARIHYHLATIYATKSQLDRSEDELRQALMYEPKLAVAHYELGKLRYYRGDLDRALIEIKAALSINPSYTVQQMYPEVDLLKAKTLQAKIYEHMGDPVHQLEILQQLVAMRRSDALYAEKIKALQKEIKKIAKENNKKPLPYDPAEVDAFISKGINNYEDGDLDAARGSFQRALDMNPRSFRAMQNLCFIQEAQGDLNSALATAQKAQALNAEFDGAVYNMAYLLEKANLPSEAGQMYERYRTMADAYPYDPQHITELQQNIIRQAKKEQQIRKRGY
jgi:tetratricopeptide (TPR) repeat protein